jgi:hypothetical protein
MEEPVHAGCAAEEPVAHVPLLVIGAGPYGLSTAAHAKRRYETARRRRSDGLLEAAHARAMLPRPAPTGTDADGVDTFEASSPRAASIQRACRQSRRVPRAPTGSVRRRVSNRARPSSLASRSLIGNS